MNRFLLIGLFVAAATSFTYAAEKEKPLKIVTQRGDVQYLTIDPSAVEDTCPGYDIFNRFNCTKDDLNLSCFDVYRMQGDPIAPQRYTLLNEELTTQDTTAEPTCNFEGPLTCDAFLKSLNYNLDFSWFIDNFPSSSYPQCQETYTCTRIACFAPLPPNAAGNVQSQKLTCVFKKNQIYFLGSEVSCQDKNNSTPLKSKPAVKTSAVQNNPSLQTSAPVENTRQALLVPNKPAAEKKP